MVKLINKLIVSEYFTSFKELININLQESLEKSYFQQGKYNAVKTVFIIFLSTPVYIYMIDIVSCVLLHKIK